MTCPNHASFRLLIVARRGSRGPTNNLALHPVVNLVLQVGDMEKFPHALSFESLNPLIRSLKNQLETRDRPWKIILTNSKRFQTSFSRTLLALFEDKE